MVHLSYSMNIDEVIEIVNVKKNIAGLRFGDLVVINQADDYIEPNGKHRSSWSCVCDCGNHVNVTGSSLLSGTTKSCGCRRRKVGKRNKKYNEYDLSGSYGIGYTSNTNQPFFFDIEDYDKIKAICWHAHKHTNGYTVIEGWDGSTHTSISQVIIGKWADHVNGNTFDNRKENLRLCTAQQNAMNRGRSSANTSGVTGVHWSKRQEKWSAYIQKYRKRVHIGYFTDKGAAIEARRAAETAYFGEWARRH